MGKQIFLLRLMISMSISCESTPVGGMVQRGQGCKKKVKLSQLSTGSATQQAFLKSMPNFFFFN